MLLVIFVFIRINIPVISEKRILSVQGLVINYLTSYGRLYYLCKSTGFETPLRVDSFQYPASSKFSFRLLEVKLRYNNLAITSRFHIIKPLPRKFAISYPLFQTYKDLVNGVGRDRTLIDWCLISSFPLPKID